MNRLPVISRKELCRTLEKIGYFIDHQTESHIILRHKGPPYRRLTVPDHKEIAKGTLRAIKRQAGLTVEQFKPRFGKLC
ncbi:MAG: type II toxin-antitoxin system HicA family toxin [Candidatus Latescibacteria bacterium]|nr:type II toxin-antitoxin system HicA family toxin [Candidatus Latescibacterota bacterium]